MLDPAVDGTNRAVLIIRGDKIIGKGRTVLKSCDEIAVRLTEGQIIEESKDLDIIQALGLENSFFRFSQWTGIFALWSHEDGDIIRLFKDIRVVDEWRFQFGLVPDTFKTVPGYDSASQDASLQVFSRPLATSI